MNDELSTVAMHDVNLIGSLTLYGLDKTGQRHAVVASIVESERCPRGVESGSGGSTAIRLRGRGGCFRRAERRWRPCNAKEKQEVKQITLHADSLPESSERPQRKSSGGAGVQKSLSNDCDGL
jgi:hypothetical protein